MAAAALCERLGALHGGRDPREPPSEALLPSPTPDFLAPMLRNLLRVYLTRDDPPHALATVDLLLVLVPDSPDDLRTRGCLYEHLDCVPAAAADFRRFLDLVPHAPDADEIRARLARLPKACQTIH